eukprot:scaffold116994_cov69-Phaeocystis_antarctica.AAC.9
MPGVLHQASRRDVAVRIPRAAAVARAVGGDAASRAGRASSEARSHAGGLPGARALRAFAVVCHSSAAVPWP